MVILASLTTLPNFASATEISGARIALVVGNGAYRGDLAALRNPVNDARLIARSLGDVGFTVRLVEDANEDALEDAVVAFGGDLRRSGSGGVALFYYAGHGVQSKGANYLIPVDAQVGSERHLKTRTVPAQLVLEEMEDAPTALNIVVLDACRNNPFAAAGRSVGGSRGLARMDTPPGSFFLAYSAAAGQVAEDGDGMNSVYTAALAAAMAQPGLELEEVFKQAGRTVRKQTGGSQVPWREGSWDGAFHFVPPSPLGSVVRPAPDEAEPGMDPEQEEWRFVRDSGNPQTIRSFLERHPDGRFAGAAQALLAQLSAALFTVQTQPPGAQVQLVGYPEPYRPGMGLPSGSYQIEVSAEGYETAMRSVSHGSSPTVLRIALRSASPQAGNRFRDCPQCPEMVVVPAGSYWMGSPPHEQGRTEREGPVHEVTIAEPFAIGRYEVTVAEFRWFVKDTGHRVYDATRSPSDYFDRLSREMDWNATMREANYSGQHPASMVGWTDAQAYVAWLSRMTGERYRLPSESEWEYAARAGTATSRYWGEVAEDLCRHANGASSFSDLSCRDGHRGAAPVGSFVANGWGLHDMLGNVYEWTEDCGYMMTGYLRIPSDGSAWGPLECSRQQLSNVFGWATVLGLGWCAFQCDIHVVRGGSYRSQTDELRAAYRGWERGPDRATGFRVARTLSP